MRTKIGSVDIFDVKMMMPLLCSYGEKNSLPYIPIWVRPICVCVVHRTQHLFQSSHSSSSQGRLLALRLLLGLKSQSLNYLLHQIRRRMLPGADGGGGGGGLSCRRSGARPFGGLRRRGLGGLWRGGGLYRGGGRLFDSSPDSAIRPRDRFHCLAVVLYRACELQVVHSIFRQKFGNFNSLVVRRVGDDHATSIEADGDLGVGS